MAALLVQATGNILPVGATPLTHYSLLTYYHPLAALT